MASFVLQILDKWFSSGQYTFKGCGANGGTTMGGLGFGNYKYLLPFNQIGWQKEDTVGQSVLSSEWVSGISTVVQQILPQQLVAGAGTVKVRQSVVLPLDFGSFGTNALTVSILRSGNVGGLKLSLYQGGSADPAVNGVSVSPAASGSFQVFSFTPSGTYSPGEAVTLELEYDVNTIGTYVQMCDVEAIFLTAAGNV